jgi:ubiquinol-cytochrome c reductase cytochrome c1 subunit
MDMNRFTTLLVAVAFGVAAGTAAATGGSGVRMEPAPINRLDAESLQRGARIFVNYCLNCHSAKYMRYNRLTDLGIDATMVQDNLIFTGKFDPKSAKLDWLPAKIGDPMTVAMRPSDAKEWLKVAPPDLSVEARVRGSDWLYNYFLGFYRDEASATGWNNLVFPNVGMPHVLWELSGSNALVETEFEDAHKAEGAAIAAKRLAKVEQLPGGKAALLTLAVDGNGAQREDEYRHTVADLVNFLDYVSEPAKNKRVGLGLVVLLYLGVLFAFAYWMKREYWKDIH